MSVEATFVFRHTDETEARRFCKELFATYPFGGDGPTHVIACSVGDSMSVADCVRGALETRALHYSEREEFALAMCECNNWDDCMELAQKWELQWKDGDFIDLRTASVDRNPEGQDGEARLGAKHESAVGEAETPNQEQSK